MKKFSEMTLDELLSVDVSELTFEEFQEHSKWLDTRMQEDRDSFAQY